MPAPDFNGVCLIVRGNSRRACRRADNLVRGLRRASPRLRIERVDTQSREGTEPLARYLTCHYPTTLNVVVGGDGTFHECLNGALTAGLGDQPLLAAYGGGFGNDNYRADQWSEEGFIAAVIRGRCVERDALTLRIEESGQTWQRYCQYAGVGITAAGAAGINALSKHGLLGEGWVAGRSLLRLRPIVIKRCGAERRLASLTFHNIRAMAKFIKLRDSVDPADGRFEVVVLRFDRRFASQRRLVAAGLRGAIRHDLPWQEQEAEYQFYWPAGGMVQLDAEVYSVSPGSRVTVTSTHNAYRTLEPLSDRSAKP